MGDNNTSRLAYALRKIHSLFGVLPLAFFICFHFYMNTFALRGPAGYNKIIDFISGNVSYLILVELVLIFLPIAWHGLYGLWLVYTGSYNVGLYSYYRNWAYLLQRLTGLVMFIFLAYHLWTLPLQRILFGKEMSFDLVSSQLVVPWVAVLYGIGLLATAYHVSNGLVSFLIKWGIIPGPNAQNWAYRVSVLLFIVFAAVGLHFELAFI